MWRKLWDKFTTATPGMPGWLRLTFVGIVGIAVLLLLIHGLAAIV